MFYCWPCISKQIICTMLLGKRSFESHKWNAGVYIIWTYLTDFFKVQRSIKEKKKEWKRNIRHSIWQSCLFVIPNSHRWGSGKGTYGLERIRCHVVIHIDIYSGSSYSFFSSLVPEKHGGSGRKKQNVGPNGSSLYQCLNMGSTSTDINVSSGYQIRICW